MINLDYIRKKGIDHFIEIQKIRIDILSELLANFDDGRSKNFYCLSCALLPVGKLEEVSRFANGLNERLESKEKSKLIKEALLTFANSLNIELKLNNKKY